MNRNKILFLLIIIVSSLTCSVDPTANNSSGLRIVSLSPSITSQVIDLGAEDNLVGITPYSKSTKEIAIVGTYVNPSIEIIISLRPDIVLMSEEDSDTQRDNFFKKFGLRYYKFGRNENFETICDNYKKLSDIIGIRNYAEKKIASYIDRLNMIKASGASLKVAFLVSVKPLIAVSGKSYISNIIERAGGDNIFDELKNPYPILTLESLIIKEPHVVIVMNPGDEQYLASRLKDFKNIEFINKKNIFAIGDENIPYYTPKDYVISVEKIYAILNHAQ